MAISHPSFILCCFTNSLSHLFPLFGSHCQLHQFFPSPFRFHGGLPRSMQFEVHIPSARPCRKKQNLSIHLLQQHLLHPHHTGIPFIQIRRPRVISLSESRETIRTVGESFQSQLGRLLRQSQAGSPHIVQLLPGLRTTLLYIPVKQIRVTGCFQSFPTHSVYSPRKTGSN